MISSETTTSQATRAPAPESKASADFASGVLEFAEKLRAFVRKRVSDPVDAEDVAQDVLLKVFRSRGALRDRYKLDAWIYQAARSTIIDYYRRKRPHDALPDDLAESIAPRDEVGEQLRRAVRGFLGTLPEIYRQPLLLTEFQGRTASEVARELGLSLTAAKSRLSRGRALLRKKLLDCCHFETDRYGRVIEMRSRRPCGAGDKAQGTRLTLPNVALSAANESDAPAIRSLLRSVELPVDDLHGRLLIHFVAANSGDHLIGCAAAEPHGDVGLLRSVAVDPTWRGRGVGKSLIQEVESLAQRLGLAQLYLLTTTAERYFGKLGYEPIERSLVPESIRKTSEFSSICPTSATVMRKGVACGCD